MNINDVIRAVLEGTQQAQNAPQATPAGSTPPSVPTHQKGSTYPTPAPSPSMPAQQPSGNVLGDILGGILNGQGQATPGGNGGGMPSGSSGGMPWGDILGTFMGAGLGSVAANTVLAPIINQVAQRFNIPPRIAQMVVAFALAQLVQSHMQGGNGQTARGTFQTQHLINGMSSRDGVSQDYLHNAGLSHDLAQRTGLDTDTSAQALQFALNALGKQAGR